jgi:hypothetical protein
MPPAHPRAAEALSVSPSPEGWRWQARGASSVIEGAAQSRSSALKTAAFAAGAMDALARAGRRRF